MLLRIIGPYIAPEKLKSRRKQKSEGQCGNSTFKCVPMTRIVIESAMKNLLFISNSVFEALNDRFD